MKLKFISKVIFSLVLLSLISGTTYLLSFSDTEPEKDKTYKEEFKKQYAIYAIDLPSEMDFAGERVPMDYFDVRESMDREMLVNTYWQSQTLLFLKRANKYFSIIEPILKKNNIPDDFKYLAVAESGLQNVRSPAGARGFWQFMKATAKEYDLEVTKQVDERYNLEKSTEAACKYLNDAYRKYKSWTLVAASYNMGMGGLSSHLRAQEVDNYYDLELNAETARYVYRIVAIKTILSSPEKYGFHFRDKDLYQNIATYSLEVDTTIINLAAYAKEQNSNLKMLKAFNPWLRKKSLEVKPGKTYTIKLPKKDARKILIMEEEKTVIEKHNLTDSIE